MAATRISAFPMYKNGKYSFCQLFLALLQDQMTALSNHSYTLNIKIPPLSYTLSLKKKIPVSDGALASSYRPLKRVPFPQNQGRLEVGVAGPCTAKKVWICLLRLRELQGDLHTIPYDVTNQSTFYFISLLFSKWSSHTVKFRKFQTPFLRGLYSEGLIYGLKFAFQNRLGYPYSWK